MQGALAKERREIKMAAQQALMNNKDNEDDGDIVRPDDPFACMFVFYYYKGFFF